MIIFQKSVLILCLIYAYAHAQFDAKSEFQKNCMACHSIGEGDKIGPDLHNLSKRRSVEWIKKFMSYPLGMIEGDEEEEGYEKADPVAKALKEVYVSMMAEQAWASDMGKVKQMVDYIKAESKKKGEVNKKDAKKYPKWVKFATKYPDFAKESDDKK